MRILITGAAGFIGYHLAERMIEADYEVIGLDSVNDYYDINLKYARLNQTGISKRDIEYGKLLKSTKYSNYQFIQLKLEDRDGLNRLFEEQKFDRVCNLAAQAGVRYSLTNPHAYIDSNIIGFLNVLEACRHYTVKHLVYASSSSVYGLNEQIPFTEQDNVDHPVSLYAASKKSNELMAHTYSHLFQIPTTGLRFFTVYGPWGRPDMALFIFTKAILEGKPVQVFNNGEMKRDFTYIADIVEGLYRILTNQPPAGDPDWTGKNPDPSTSKAPYRIFNIGNSKPVQLMDFISAIEKQTGKKAILEYLPMQSGDVKSTWASVDELYEVYKYKPHYSIEDGISQFYKWYKQYFKI